MAGSAYRDLVVRIVGDAKGMTAATKQAETGLASFERGIGKVQSALATAFAGGMLVRFAKESAQAALEDSRAQERLAKTLQNVVKASDEQVAAVERSIKTMETQFAVADDELRPAFETLVRATKDVGQAQSLMQLALDVSAGSGKGLQEVTVALVKAMGGQMRGLKDLGIQVKTASGDTASFADVQRQLNTMFSGQAAAAADSQTGRLKALGIQYENLKESVGTALLPVLMQLAGIANSLFGWFNGLSESTQHLIAQVVIFGGIGFTAVKTFLAIKEAIQLMNISMASTPWGAIAAGIGIIAGAFLLSRKSADSATQSTDDYVAALRRSTDESKKAVEAKVLEALANKDVAWALDKAGVKASDAAKYILGYTDAVDISRETVAKYNGKVMRLSDYLGMMRDRLADARVTADRLNKTEGELSGTTEEAAAATDQLNVSMANTSKAIKNVTDGWTAALQLPAQWTADLNESARKSEEWATRTKAAYDDAFNHLDAIVRNDQLSKDLDDKLKKYKDFIKKHGATTREALSQSHEVIASVAESAASLASLLPGFEQLSETEQKTLSAQYIVEYAQNVQSKFGKGSPMWIALQELIDQFWKLAGAQSGTSDMVNGIQMHKDKNGNWVPGPAPKTEGKASGGRVAAGTTYLVGEKGPEMLTMGSQAGFITPNNALADGSAGNNITIQVTAPQGTDPYTWGQTIVSALKAYVRTNGKIAGIAA